MNVNLESLDTGWSLVGVGLRTSEINEIIKLLELVRDGSIDHFHLHADFEHTSPSGIADVEISLAVDDQPDNMGIG